MDDGKHRSVPRFTGSNWPLSVGALLIVLSTGLALGFSLTPRGEERSRLTMWTFSREHLALYEAAQASGDVSSDLDIDLVALRALQRRVWSGLRLGTPLADIVEIERAMAAQIFSGPLEGVGLVDLTDRVRAEGLDERLAEGSFALWTKQDRIFGIPHDIHPVLLSYRSDITDAAGIDPTRAETWTEFVELMRPLQDTDGDGEPDRFIMNLGLNELRVVELLILQGGGTLFDVYGSPTLVSDENIRTVATLGVWMSDGPGRVAIDAAEFTASGSRLKLEGRVLCSLMPDWLTSAWRGDMPQLSGKIKLMPLPAWEPGGRRTSVWGGTMASIPATSKNIDEAWEAIRSLYLSREVAERTFDQVGIISPNRDFWDGAWYDRPDPYYNDQPVGRLYINEAHGIPKRSNSVYNGAAQAAVRDAIARTRTVATERQAVDPQSLYDAAEAALVEAQAEIARQIDRDRYIGRSADAIGGDS